MRRATRTAIQVAMAAALVAGGGCAQKKRTEIIVGLATDLDAPAPLASVQLQVLKIPGNYPVGTAEVRDISGDPLHPYTIPGTYGVYSDAGTGDRVQVKLIAVDNAGNTLVVRTAVFNLVPEKTLFVRLGLVSACVNRTDCDEDHDQTCIDGRCVSDEIESSTLPAYQPGAENELSCANASTVSYIDTSTKLPLMTSGTPCASGVCAEGVCLVPPPGGFGGAGGSPGVGGQGGTGGFGGAGGSPGVGGQGGAAGAGGDSAVTPQLTSLVPASGTAGTSVTLQVRGQGIGAGWTIVFDGNSVPTTIAQDSDGTFATTTLNILTNIATGQVPVWLVKGTLVSNTLYFTVMPAPGAPTIVDYTPDNAMPGTTITIVGTNLLSEPVSITDPLGRPMPVLAMGTTQWLGVSEDSVDVAVPSDMVTGALTASNTLGSFRGRVFNVGENLSRIAGAVPTSSTEYNTTNWSTASGLDNNLQTSWFAAHGDCASMTTCTTVPYFQVTFPTPQTVARLAFRGNREYASNYNFTEGRFDILNATGAVLWSEDRLLPEPNSDLDILVSPAVAGASAIRFTSVADQSNEPGLSEFEVFGP